MKKREESESDFNHLAERLNTKVYQSAKGAVRMHVLWNDMLASMPFLTERPLRILDAGGGMGQISRKLAALGHNVVLCDISEEMLKIASACIKEESLDKKITLLHSSMTDLSLHLEENSFDIITVHGVLEWMDNPEDALKGLLRFLSPGGYLSLLFFNVDRLILKCGIYGMFNSIKTGSYIKVDKKRKLTPTNPLNQYEVKSWIEEQGMTIVSKAGIRIFYNLFKNKHEFKDRMQELQDAEYVYSRREPYASIAQHIHYVCRNNE
jgi:S-adenosylmethionine-dependent methyltransferase